MHLEDGPQPAGALVVMALHRLGVFRKLSLDESDASAIVDNDCRDPNTVHQRHQYVCQVQRGKQVVRVDLFGGAVKLSEYCPGYNPKLFDSTVEEFGEAIKILRAPVIGLSSHGEHCGLCQDRGITVAQRIFLTVNARLELKRALAPKFGKIGVYTTYHRRYIKTGEEFQKTRIIDHHHHLFRDIPMDKIMAMSDPEIVHLLAPDLLERVAI